MCNVENNQLYHNAAYILGEISCTHMRYNRCILCALKLEMLKLFQRSAIINATAN